ncbi:MAG: histidinol-phosphatase [Lachnospiraceae bacterium]|nr:histidinol-phosphatase [Lachnospiraceae bacterium]
MIANYHTHTIRCHHAGGTEREYIEAAIEKGFQILGFSDHTPQPYPKYYTSGIRMSVEELPDYTDTLCALREEYKDQIRILIGLEAEYSPAYFDDLLKLLKDYPIDYLIQGQHYVSDEITGFYAGDMTDSEERLKAYVDTTIEGMKTGCFTYLAHPDLINFTGSDAIYQNHMRRLVETAITLSIPLEVNMYGFIGGRWYPKDRFFSMASVMGASFVIGCDAHNPKIIAQPEDVPFFKDFLDRNDISADDNLVTLRPVGKSIR